MPTYVASNGDDFVVKQLDRSYKGILQDILKVDGKTGTLTVANLTNSGNLTVTGTATIGGKTPATGTFYSKVQAGKNGAGALTLTGAKVGDKVIAIANITTPGDAKASFEATITVADQIQQSSASDLSAQQILFILNSP